MFSFTRKKKTEETAPQPEKAIVKSDGKTSAEREVATDQDVKDILKKIFG